MHKFKKNIPFTNKLLKLFLIISLITSFTGSVFGKEISEKSPPVASPPTTSYKGGQLGIGIILGEPTGLSFAYRLSRKNFLSTALTWSVKDDEFRVYMDYYFRKWNLTKDEFKEVDFPVQIGIGLKGGVSNEKENSFSTEEKMEAAASLRFPFGMSGVWLNYPFEIFLEIAPGMKLIPEPEFDLDGGLGVRYFF